MKAETEVDRIAMLLRDQLPCTAAEVSHFCDRVLGRRGRSLGMSKTDAWGAGSCLTSTCGTSCARTSTTGLHSLATVCGRNYEDG